ncbi:MAG: hypothetical protein HY698_01525 [Deltaproteobacteria bacterium]|nr:hypothetical protein [Deltaproteobacteria bacterium]
MGRVYVRQRGTSVVRTLTGKDLYYAFPERTAVVDAMFNGKPRFEANPEVYRNDRFRDRPYLNTAWDLILNMRDEGVNKDINLETLTDVFLYVFYTDFTGL